MLSERALYYLSDGYNCAQCILRGAADEYNLDINEQCYRMCAALSMGLGIGSVCSLLQAGIMLFGLMFDEQTAKSMRMKLFDAACTEHMCLNCPMLRNEKQIDDRCELLVFEFACLIDELAHEEHR